MKHAEFVEKLENLVQERRKTAESSEAKELTLKALHLSFLKMANLWNAIFPEIECPNCGFKSECKCNWELNK